MTDQMILASSLGRDWWKSVGHGITPRNIPDKHASPTGGGGGEGGDRLLLLMQWFIGNDMRLCLSCGRQRRLLLNFFFS
jgi:hypothetical protein